MSRIIGLDPGTRRIGVAVSDASRQLAFPRDALDASSDVTSQVRQMISDEGADVVVVGRPLALSGRITTSTKVADEFRSRLASELSSVTVLAVDERLSTVSASNQLREAGRSAKQQRSVIDSASAVILLQGYLDGLVD